MTQTDDQDVKPIQSLADLVLDDNNANLGTERGMWSLQESVIRFGVGRGIVVDRRGRVIGGNKTTETLGKLNPTVKVVVVPSDGDTLVVTQRTDLDLEDDPEARELAFADNRVGELNLAWDAQRIAQAAEAGLDLAAFFHHGEADSLAQPEDALTPKSKGDEAGNGSAAVRALRLRDARVQKYVGLGARGGCLGHRAARVCVHLQQGRETSQDRAVPGAGWGEILGKVSLMRISCLILDENEMREAVTLWLQSRQEHPVRYPLRVTSCKQVQEKRGRLFGISVEQEMEVDAGCDSIPEEG